MLRELMIQNFIIVDRLQLDFESGMTVITGETGAGKSILLDAIEFVSGSRFDATIIRQGATQCDVSAVFQVRADHPLVQYLADQDLLSEGEVVLRRIITQEGRSKVYINQQPATLAQLKHVALMLIDLMGQHEHQNFLKADVQLNSLDQYAKTGVLRETVKAAYLKMTHLDAALKKLESSEAERATQLDLQRYQLNELTEFNLEENELTTLYQEQKKLSSVQDLLSVTGKLLAQIKEEEPSLLAGHTQVDRELQCIARDFSDLARAAEMWKEAQVLIVEAVHDIQHFHESLELDPERLQTVENRLIAIHALARKYHVGADDLWALQLSLQAELSSDASVQAKIEAVKAELLLAESAYFESARSLSDARKIAALSLQGEITKLMKELGMPQGECKIELLQEAGESYVTGIDRIQFLVRINPGQPLQSLKSVVSGGELSRIALIMAVLTTQGAQNSLLIFDEVDVGVSGAVAEQVADLIHRLAEDQQILCITHLPQVAKEGDHHLHITKRFTDTETFSEAAWLTFDERVNEIARMMSGKEVTPAALQHVRENMKARSDSTASSVVL